MRSRLWPAHRGGELSYSRGQSRSAQNVLTTTGNRPPPLYERAEGLGLGRSEAAKVLLLLAVRRPRRGPAPSEHERRRPGSRYHEAMSLCGMLPSRTFLMSRLRVLICRVDEDDDEQMTEVARVDLPAVPGQWETRWTDWRRR